MGLRTKQEKVVDARTSATSGTAVVATVLLLDGRALDEFEQLHVYVQVTTALIGTTPTMDIYLQRAVVPNPDPANDAHWDDYFALDQITTNLLEEVITLPVQQIAAGAESVSIQGHVRITAALGERVLRVGHWGDRLRIVEKIGGTVTTQAIYNIIFTGILRSSE